LSRDHIFALNKKDNITHKSSIGMARPLIGDREKGLPDIVLI
jgi:hypothetical protein